MPKNTSPRKKPLSRSASFEKAFERLEETVRLLEKGQMSLEESKNLFKEGMELASHCNKILETAELEVTRLKENFATQMSIMGNMNDPDDDDDL